jgi:hypothetical protein
MSDFEARALKNLHIIKMIKKIKLGTHVPATVGAISPREARRKRNLSKRLSDPRKYPAIMAAQATIPSTVVNEAMRIPLNGPLRSMPWS